MKWTVGVLAACAPLVSAIIPIPSVLTAPSPHIAIPNANTGSGTFQQLIDHSHPELGTFSQRYWWNAEYWAGSGSPVVLISPGETAAEEILAFLTNQTITGLFAQEIKGAVIILEHRYWGKSTPFEDLSTKNLQYLTIKNVAADLTNFARTVQLPFDRTNSSQAGVAPWVLSGLGYTSALSAWIENIAPGTFWAYHASSAPVQAISNFWQYFAPEQEGLPKECSNAISLAIDQVDDVLLHGSQSDVNALKQTFGLEALNHDDDFASALLFGPFMWQSSGFNSINRRLVEFCNYVEGVASPNQAVKGAQDVDPTVALAGYASWMKTVFVPGFCAKFGYWTHNDDVSCFDYHNASSPIFTDHTINPDSNRQSVWLQCNEALEWAIVGAPVGTPSLASRTLGASYTQRQCDLYFPPEDNFTYGTNPKNAHPASVDATNQFTGGWSHPDSATSSTRVLWVNGEFDPWRSASVSSSFRPGGPLQSTPEHPVLVIPGGFHASDMYDRDNAWADPAVAAVIQKEVAQIKAWVAEYKRPA